MRRAGVSCLALTVLFLALPACKRRESVEAARDRAAENFLVAQIASLKELVGRAEGGQLVTKDRIVIGIAEETVKELFDASLPQEQKVGDRVVVRLETAQAYFRGNNAALVFQASAQGTRTGARARLEIGGRLSDFRIENGILTANAFVVHFKVIEAPGGDLASEVLERLAKEHSDELTKLIPPLNLPVSLKQSIDIPGLDEGVVMAKGGTLPLEVAVAETIPVNQRLWVLLDVKAGPWKSRASPKTAAPAAKPSPAEKKS